MLVSKSQRGDTIIEVLFAIAVFSLIAVGGISIMNQGTALAQRSLEVNLVRQQMDTQAEALRYLNQAYVADYGKNGTPTTLWQSITAKKVIAASSFDTIVTGGTCTVPISGFAIDTKKIATSNFIMPSSNNPATYAKIRYDTAAPAAEGIWIQAVESAGNNFYDFHIRACWSTPGSAVPTTLGTIVRLYEPAA